MTTSEVLNEMSRGATLCMEHGPDGKTYWIEPRRVLIRSDIAEKIIATVGVVASNDKLFRDEADQTWKIRA